MSDMEKKSNKKTYVIFAIVMVICLVVGFFSAAIMSLIRFYISDINWEGTINTCSVVFPVAFGVLNLVALLCAFVSYKKSKGMVETWDGENEEEVDKIERRLDFPMIVSTVLMVVDLFLFALGTYWGMKNTLEEDWTVLSDVGIFLVSIMLILVAQNLVISLEKKLNPEKQGNAFDFKFKKKWEGSMDEAELMMVAKASKAGYGAGNTTCMIMWMMSLFGMMFFETGIFPVFCVTIIWLAMVIAYFVACMKLERGKQ